MSLPGPILLLSSPGRLGLLLLAEALEVHVLVDLPAQLPSAPCLCQLYAGCEQLTELYALPLIRDILEACQQLLHRRALVVQDWCGKWTR